MTIWWNILICYECVQNNPLINSNARDGVQSTRMCKFIDLRLGLSGLCRRYKLWPQRGLDLNFVLFFAVFLFPHFYVLLNSKSFSDITQVFCPRFMKLHQTFTEHAWIKSTSPPSTSRSLSTCSGMDRYFSWLYWLLKLPSVLVIELDSSDSLYKVECTLCVVKWSDWCLKFELYVESFQFKRP